MNFQGIRTHLIENKILSEQHTWQRAPKVEIHFPRNVFILQLNSKWSEKRNKDTPEEMFALGPRF